MKVTFVRPYTITTAGAVGEDTAPPVGVAYLAAAARKAGHEVTVIDALGEGIDVYERIETLKTGMRHGISDEEIIDRIPKDTQVLAVSTMFSLEWPFTRDLITKIKAAFPQIVVVAGGEHTTAMPEYSMRDCPAIDCCGLGEGELILLDVLEAVENGTSFADVPGLCYWEDGAILRSIARSRNRQFFELPWPAWDLVPIEKYLSSGAMTGVNFGRSMPIVASRGCPYQCTFCSNPIMWGTLWRIRTVDDVIAEMKYYMATYDVVNFDFYDLTAIVKKAWIVEFCERLIEENLKITWQLPSGTRSEALDETVTRLLYASGCKYINYAPESGSEEMLVMIKKKIKVDRMLVSMKDGVKNDLNIKANMIMGFPGETSKHRWQSLKFILQMSYAGINDVSVFPFSPYPGSELFMTLEKSGEIVVDDNYFISLSQYTDPVYTKSYCETLSAQQLRLWCLISMAVFYGSSFLFRPLRLFRLLRDVLKMKSSTKLGDALVRIRKKSVVLSKQA